VVRITRSWLHRGLLTAGILLVMLRLAQPSTTQNSVETTHDYTFGQTATFEWRAPNASAAETAQIYLRYHYAGKTTTTAYRPTTVETTTLQYVRDLHATPLPPFAPITYWWEYHDTANNTYQTPLTTFTYEDNRFEWQTLQDRLVTVHWIAGERALMLPALDASRKALDELSVALQIQLSEPFDLYIYPSSADLQSALRLGGHEWVGGEAQPELGVALLAIPPSSTAFSQMQRDIPHELAHLTLYRYTDAYGYAMLPTWLLEGFASHFEQRPDPLYAVTLEQTRTQGRLLSLQSLCGAFPPEREAALLAYAQSASFVTYLRQTYGWSGIRTLLAAYSDGQGCAEGVQSLGRDLPTVERAWWAWLEQGGNTGDSQQQWGVIARLVARTLAPWLLLLSMLLLPSFLVYLRNIGNAKSLR